MSDRIYIPYSGCPVEALEAAIAQHGADNAYILVPHEHWHRFQMIGLKGAPPARSLARLVPTAGLAYVF
ncbi:uncharacterized protein Dvar_00140 [Desulfosarcina variabilis str. Montpellier]|uniref:hypothetical protein n=1 Tax=Desulfosarcina variabilis TaxID=2300 RepID=UPI003AFB5661